MRPRGPSTPSPSRERAFTLTRPRKRTGAISGAEAGSTGRISAERPSTGSLSSSPSTPRTPTGSPLGAKYPPFTPATAATRSAIALTRSRRAILSFERTPWTRAGWTASTLIRTGPLSRTIVVHSTPGSTSTAPAGPAQAMERTKASAAIRLRTPDRLGCARDPVRPSRVRQLHEGPDIASAARASPRACDGRSLHRRDAHRRALRSQSRRPDPGSRTGLRRDHRRVRRDPHLPRDRHAIPPGRADGAHPGGPVDALRAEPHRGGARLRPLPQALGPQ